MASSALASSISCLAMRRLSSRPSREGYVVLPTASSLPAVLPSCSDVSVQSKMSSITWKARPMSCAYRVRRAMSSSSAPPRRAPHTTAASSSAAVLCAWMYCKVSRLAGVPPRLTPSISISTICPPTSPSDPTHFATYATTRSTIRGSTLSSGVAMAMYSNARVKSPSPARIAHCSPYTLWLVGLPRRKSSLSMQGRSSCMRLIVWIISSAHAVGMATLESSVNISHAAMQSAGRMRLPPASRE
mmetsp:Transcript_9077/g.15595  ORF Transcript_9077/g.15595 Transcript_9077/m.15595 type:complete len:244 (+) Transcript_9077:826-1557(+)